MIYQHTYLFIMFFSSFAGIVYGLFGGGSGLFLMPAYYFALKDFSLATDLKMQMAIATTAMSTSFIAIPALMHQFKLKNIDLNLSYKIFWGILTGSILAVILLNIIPSTILKFLFGFIVILISVWLFFYKQSHDNKPWQLKGIKNFICTTGIGFLWFALGVAVFNVPYLLKCRVNIYKAIGTATIVGTIFSLIVGLMLMVSGYFHIGYSYNHIGFVNITFLLLTAIPGMIGAYFGAKLSHILPKEKLKEIYAILVLIVGIIMVL